MRKPVYDTETGELLGYSEPSDAERLEAVRQIFREFDWGHSDLQYAMEKIQEIVE